MPMCSQRVTRRHIASAMSAARERSCTYEHEGNRESHPRKNTSIQKAFQSHSKLTERHAKPHSVEDMYCAHRCPYEIKQTGGTGHNRVCDFGRSDRSHCDPCHNGFSAQITGALGCNCKRHQQSLAAYFNSAFSQGGQSTVEFALVTAGLLAMLVACGALWQFFDAGMLVKHALSCASHHIGGTVLGGLGDVFLY